MEKLVNSADLKSAATACRFESDRAHQFKEYQMVTITVYYELRGEPVTTSYTFPKFSSEILDTVNLELYRFKDYQNYKLVLEHKDG